MRFENRTIWTFRRAVRLFRPTPWRRKVSLPRSKGIVYAYDANIERKSLNNNGQNQFSENGHPQQTIVLTKTAGLFHMGSSTDCKSCSTLLA